MSEFKEGQEVKNANKKAILNAWDKIKEMYPGRGFVDVPLGIGNDLVLRFNSQPRAVSNSLRRSYTDVVDGKGNHVSVRNYEFEKDIQFPDYIFVTGDSRTHSDYQSLGLGLGLFALTTDVIKYELISHNEDFRGKTVISVEYDRAQAQKGTSKERAGWTSANLNMLGYTPFEENGWYKVFQENPNYPLNKEVIGRLQRHSPPAIDGGGKLTS